MKVSRTGGSDFAPPRQGVHIAVCTRVIDLGTQETTWQGKTKSARKVMLTWELPEEPLVDVDGELLPVIVQARYTASLHEKADLCKLLTSWRGRAFTEAELGGFDLKNVLGAGCQLNLVHTDDGKYANIGSIMPLPRGFPRPAHRGELIHVDLDDFDPTVMSKLSDKLRELIGATKEYRIATGKAQPADTGGMPSYMDDNVPFDDEIPF